MLRGDIARLQRCVDIITGEGNMMPRCKPFKYTYEKEIVMYAYYKKLDYFSTECIYSPFAYRGFAREFLKDLEQEKKSSIIGMCSPSSLLTFASCVLIDRHTLSTRHHPLSRVLRSRRGHEAADAGQV